jgi:sRNA-binding regulator protein Hfq
MKDAIDSMPAERSLPSEEFANRKLIRPSLNRNEHNHTVHNHSAAPAVRNDRSERSERNDRPHGHDRGDRPNGGGKKLPPPDQTNAENFYYQKQMQTKTPMVLVLHGGEEIHGVIEWYDKTCLKLNRIGAPNLMIYKPSIKYMYKESEK